MRDARLRKELVIRTENRVGLLAEISRILSEMGINILGVTVQTEGDSVALHLLADAHLYARDVLRAAQFPGKSGRSSSLNSATTQASFAS